MRNDNLLRDFLVQRNDVIVPRPVMKDSDDGCVHAMHRTQNTAFGPAVVPNIRDFNQYLVAMHGRVNRVRRNKNVTGNSTLQIRRSGRKIRNDEAESITM